MGNMGGRSPAPLIRTGFKAEIVQDGDMTGTERMEPAKLPHQIIDLVQPPGERFGLQSV